MKKYAVVLILILVLILALAMIILSNFKSVDNLASGPKVAKNVSVPKTITISKINLTAEVVEVGMTKEGDMSTPEKMMDVGWYKHGSLPGEAGSAVFAGHLDDISGEPAVFARLQELSLGDEVRVVDAHGTELIFEVVNKKMYDYDLPDTKEIFGGDKKRRLNLITCSGVWNKGAEVYDKRLVIFTELKSIEYNFL